MLDAESTSKLKSIQTSRAQNQAKKTKVRIEGATALLYESAEGFIAPNQQFPYWTVKYVKDGVHQCDFIRQDDAAFVNIQEWEVDE